LEQSSRPFFVYRREMIEAIVRDLRFAARGLARTPSFTAAAVLTLAIGIGATTAVFSVVYGVLLRPLPFPTADRLVRVVQILPARGGGAPGRAGLTLGQIAEWRATSRTLAEIGSYSLTALSLTDVPLPLRLNGATISVPLFRALGVPPLKGRSLAADDEAAGNDHVVLLSHALWMGRFAGSDEILERTLTLGGQPYRVIGVMPPGFGFPSLARPGMSLNADGGLSDAPEFWIPMVKQARPSGRATGGMTLVPTFALLGPGISKQQAAAEANGLMPARADRRFQIELVSAREEQGRDVSRVLLVFQAAVLFVLFIACANVTNLLLARAASRRRELAVRLAIGASRAQIARFAMSESAIIGAAGGVAGCVLAFQAVALIRALPPYVLPRLSEIRVDGVVLALACTVAIGSGLLVGLWTAVRMLRGASLASGRPHRPSQILVIAETAAGVLLLAGAALLLGSFVHLTRVDRGLDPAGVFTFRVSLPSRLQAPSAQYAFHDQLTSTMKGLRGVEAVGGVERALGSSSTGFTLIVDGQTTQAPIEFQAVTPGVFDALRIPLRGRDFSPADRTETAAAIIVNAGFARRYFDGRDPIGQRIGFQDWRSLEIIGVAADIRPTDAAKETGPMIFMPVELSRGFGAPTYVVRSRMPPATLVPLIREAVAGIDASAVVFDATPLESLLQRQVTTPKFYGLTATGFAGVAVLLAALGLYGVLSYSVTARTRELGIRIAIGASRRRVIVSVMREALAAVFAGVAIGLAGAFYSSRFLEALLFGVRSHDPATLAGVAGVFLSVALVAAYIPARRAARVDPIVALRAE
jgi:putative ABC transport system permease protein